MSENAPKVTYENPRNRREAMQAIEELSSGIIFLQQELMAAEKMYTEGKEDIAKKKKEMELLLEEYNSETDKSSLKEMHQQMVAALEKLEKANETLGLQVEKFREEYGNFRELYETAVAEVLEEDGGEQLEKKEKDGQLLH